MIFSIGVDKKNCIKLELKDGIATVMSLEGKLSTKDLVGISTLVNQLNSSLTTLGVLYLEATDK